MTKLTRERIREIVKEELARRSSVLLERDEEVARTCQRLRSSPEAQAYKANAEKVCKLLPIVCCVQELFINEDHAYTEEQLHDWYQRFVETKKKNPKYWPPFSWDIVFVVYEIVAGDDPDEWYQRGLPSVPEHEIAIAAKCDSWVEITQRCPELSSSIVEGITHSDWEIKSDFDPDISWI